MRKILSAIMILLLSAGIVLAQNTITPKPSSNSGNSGTTTTTTTKSGTNTNNSGSQGSTETKGNPSTSTTYSSTNSSTETSPWANTSTTDDTPATTTTAKSDFTLDHFIIGGGISAGALISTDIISTGGMLNAEFEVMVQFKHHRMGIGGDKTLMLNLRNLGTVIGTLGESN